MAPTRVYLLMRLAQRTCTLLTSLGRLPYSWSLNVISVGGESSMGLLDSVSDSVTRITAGAGVVIINADKAVEKAATRADEASNTPGSAVVT